MLIALAGLPATGKSTLARHLAAALPGVVLNKDSIRACLFPPDAIDYSPAEGDLCVAIMYQVAAYMVDKAPHTHVIIDGRTFTKQQQVADLLAAAQRMDTPLKIIECVCSDAAAQRRLLSDTAHGRHQAQNRTFELYLALKRTAEPITALKFVINTENDVASYVADALAYIQQDA